MRKLTEIIGGILIGYSLLTGCNGSGEIKQVEPKDTTPIVIPSETKKEHAIRLFQKFEDDYSDFSKNYVENVRKGILNTQSLEQLTQIVRDGNENFREVLRMERSGLTQGNSDTLKQEISSAFEKMLNAAYDTDADQEGYQNKAEDIRILAESYADLMNSVMPGTVKIQEYAKGEETGWIVTDGKKQHVISFGTDNKVAKKLEIVPSDIKKEDYLESRDENLKEKIVYFHNHGSLPGDNDTHDELKKVLDAYFKTAEGQTLHASIGFLGYRNNEARTRNNAGIHTDFEKHPEFNVARAYVAGKITPVQAAEMVAEAQKGGRYVINGTKLADVAARSTDLGSDISGLFESGLIRDASNESRKLSSVSEFDERMGPILDRTEKTKMRYQALPYFKK